MTNTQESGWLSVMISLIIVCAFWTGVIWAIYSAFFTDQYYFLVSEEHADLEEYLLAGNAHSQRECRELVDYWTDIGAKSAHCKRVPTWRHWTNVGQNLIYQWDLLVNDDD